MGLFDPDGRRGLGHGQGVTDEAGAMTFHTLDQAQLAAKRALVRVDFNVPVKDGQVVDDARLRSALPTIKALRQAGAKTILISHFGRPKGKPLASMSLRPVVAPLAKLLGAHVAFAEDCVGPVAKAAVDAMKPGEVLLLENLRFHPGEEANDPHFSRALAANGDLYINDAFSTAHRAHASTVGLAHLLPSYAGEDMRRELTALRAALDHPAHPVLGIVGGSKVSTKLGMLHNLILKLDRLAIGGGMANTFLFSQGCPVGASICEKDLAGAARGIMAFAEKHNCELLLPVDVVVARLAAPGAMTRVCAPGHVDDVELILDAGPKTLLRLIAAIDEAKTLIWNGPLGVFEIPPFDKATVAAARHAAERVKAGKLVAVAGGGDTDAALRAAGVVGDFTFVSTAGGAFLQWMEGKTLPGVTALENQLQRQGL
jgi:phosphoglycerate kinase